MSPMSRHVTKLTKKQQALCRARFENWRSCIDFGFEWALQLARWRCPDEDPLEVVRRQLEEGSRQHQAAILKLARRLSEAYRRENERAHRRGPVRRRGRAG